MSMGDHQQRILRLIIKEADEAIDLMANAQDPFTPGIAAIMTLEHIRNMARSAMEAERHEAQAPAAAADGGAR